MSKSLVIVESPTKAKTISKYLGKDFIVKSSFGHVRDLPKSKMGIDVEHNFEPQYIVSKDKMKIVKELKEAAKKTDTVLLATDADREGEAISWHLAHILGINEKKAKRITFHEITKTAIEEALAHPRGLDLKLVDAQQARRVLDRLVGYELSPFLWRKIAKGLSAGRVQSVAVRLVVEREREIKDFKTEEYWTLEAKFSPLKEDFEFSAHLHALGDKKFDKLDIKTQAEIDKIVGSLNNVNYKISALDQKDMKRLPPPPFTTSALQQEANNRLGFSAKQTMRLAQQLYEGVELGSEGSVGLITYMRTDAVNLSDKFLSEAKEIITKDFGEKYALAAPRYYKNKNKNAQEAHEAIRPTEAARTPDDVKPFLEKNQFRLYDLIWRRAVATQMAPAEVRAANLDITSDNHYVFRATGHKIIFEGFLKLFPDRVKDNILPAVAEGDAVTCRELKPEQHFTEPPARYSDATLVKALEEYGIGRPSTYAPTIATIEERGYVERDDKKRLAPKDIAFVVNDLLVAHFPHIVDYQFTADLEEKFDAIARGEKEWVPVVAEFYGPFKKNLLAKDKELNKKELTETASDEKCDKCGAPMVVKMGRYGKFLACSAYPDCKNIKSLGGAKPQDEKTVELINSLQEKHKDEKCEKCGSPMVVKTGRYGPFLACSAYPKCKNIKNIQVEGGPGVTCPNCGQGQLIARRSRRGIFYGCNRYPDCKTAFWDKPLDEKCPDCGSLLVQDKKGQIKCSNKECDYKKP